MDLVYRSDLGGARGRRREKWRSRRPQQTTKLEETSEQTGSIKTYAEDKTDILSGLLLQQVHCRWGAWCSTNCLRAKNKGQKSIVRKNVAAKWAAGGLGGDPGRLSWRFLVFVFFGGGHGEAWAAVGPQGMLCTPIVANKLPLKILGFIIYEWIHLGSAGDPGAPCAERLSTKAGPRRPPGKLC